MGRDREIEREKDDAIICETEARGPAGRREREIERRKTTRGRLTIILCRASTNKRQKHSFYSFHPKVTLAARCSKHLFATTRTFEPKGLVLYFVHSEVHI